MNYSRRDCRVDVKECDNTRSLFFLDTKWAIGQGRYRNIVGTKVFRYVSFESSLAGVKCYVVVSYGLARGFLFKS